MTTDTFILLLARSRVKFGYRYELQRQFQLDSKQNWVQTAVPMGFAPKESVYRYSSGMWVYASVWHCFTHVAGQEDEPSSIRKSLGLSSADYVLLRSAAGEIEPFQKELRQRILQAVGLEKPPTAK